MPTLRERVGRLESLLDVMSACDTMTEAERAEVQQAAIEQLCDPTLGDQLSLATFDLLHRLRSGTDAQPLVEALKDESLPELVRSKFATLLLMRCTQEQLQELTEKQMNLGLVADTMLAQELQRVSMGLAPAERIADLAEVGEPSFEPMESIRKRIKARASVVYSQVARRPGARALWPGVAQALVEEGSPEALALLDELVRESDEQVWDDARRQVLAKTQGKPAARATGRCVIQPMSAEGDCVLMLLLNVDEHRVRPLVLALVPGLVVDARKSPSEAMPREVGQLLVDKQLQSGALELSLEEGLLPLGAALIGASLLAKNTEDRLLLESLRAAAPFDDVPTGTPWSEAEARALFAEGQCAGWAFAEAELEPLAAEVESDHWGEADKLCHARARLAALAMIAGLFERWREDREAAARWTGSSVSVLNEPRSSFVVALLAERRQGLLH